MTTAPAQDIIDVLIVQRNNALNIAADTEANLRVATREIEALRKDIDILNKAEEKKEFAKFCAGGLVNKEDSHVIDPDS